MSKFAIDSGHGDINGSLGGDGGAVGFLNEQNCTLDIGTRVINKLNQLGHQAWQVRPTSASSLYDSLQKRCDAGANADYYVSIHLNAGGGTGSEVYAMSSSGKDLAQKVLTELVALGYTNRGVKDGSNLYVIKHSRPVAILVECCFVDNQKDASDYNAESIANAIVQGITGQTVLSDNKSYRLMTGTFASKDSAVNYCNYLKTTYNVAAYTVDGTVLSGTPQGTYRVITDTFVGDSTNIFANKLRANGTTVYIVDTGVLK